MKNLTRIIKELAAVIIIASFISAVTSDMIVIQQVSLDANNINAWFYNTGIFDQDLRSSNHPGFEWPKGTGKYAIFTAGLCCGGYIQNNLREFMCSYKGELAPGYIIDSAGIPKAKTDYKFKIYKVSRTDNHINNPDWLYWGYMVPYGAPFIDVNHNGTYEPLIDTPGVQCAAQTLFACLTDGFPEEHKVGEGFGGGTPPMFAEVRITAWCYDIPGMQDIQYIKWQVINKNKYLWDSTFFGIVSDIDLGFADDDYKGCDTIRKLSYIYNSDNNDEGNSYAYGINPPAAGFKLLRSAKNNNGQFIGMSSGTYFMSTSIPGAICEKDPNGEILQAYNFLKGLKKDGTPWVIPPGGDASYVTRYCYTGDPETGVGWNERPPGNPTGSVWNCGGPYEYNGYYKDTNYCGDYRIILGTGVNSLKVNPGDTQIIVAAQLVARGSNNLNSVTKLKQLSDVAQKYYDSNYVNGICGGVIGISNNSNEIPLKYKLYQNYPNPFNPTTKIRASLAPSKGGKQDVKLVIYDVLGKEVTTLAKDKLNAGTYEFDWNASNYPSGVYFYSLIVDNVSVETKRMVLLK